MQNNVTELTQKLLRSLDSNYNVIDMPAVIETISLLEKVAITKELLETTRLGKHVNELRRNTSNELLAKRAKELVKKWRSMVLPDSNGQLKPSENDHASDDVQNRKRAAKDCLENTTVKRVRVNGQVSEFEFSDNSNSSFKDLLGLNTTPNKSAPIIINSDSNSSFPETRHEPLLEQPLPKKRGRKKGSKNHKNLIEEAETSFSNKLNVSRGNAKVKTTQELLADLQIKNTGGTNLNLQSPGKPIEDLNERAAKLTERVSIIDQQLNANSNRYRNSQKKYSQRNNLLEKPEGDSSLKNSPNLKSSTDDEIIIVDDLDEKEEIAIKTSDVSDVEPRVEPIIIVKSLAEEEALALLPPIDRTALDDVTGEPSCSCQLIENNTDFSIDVDEEVNTQHTYSFVESSNCLAKSCLEEQYKIYKPLDTRVHDLHATYMPSVNGNFGEGGRKSDAVLAEDGLFVNIVPNINIENIPKINDSSNFIQPASENFKKYSISESGDDSGHCGQSTVEGSENVCSDNQSEVSDKQIFREWHEVLELPSYNGEIFKILPYVIID